MENANSTASKAKHGATSEREEDRGSSGSQKREPIKADHAIHPRGSEDTAAFAMDGAPPTIAPQASQSADGGVRDASAEDIPGRQPDAVAGIVSSFSVASLASAADARVAQDADLPRQWASSPKEDPAPHELAAAGSTSPTAQAEAVEDASRATTGWLKPRTRALSPLHRASRSKSPRNTALGASAGSAFGKPTPAHGKRVPATASGFLHPGPRTDRPSPVSFPRGSGSQLLRKGSKGRLTAGSPKTAGVSSARTSADLGRYLSEELLDPTPRDPTPRDLEFLTTRNNDDLDGPLEVDMPPATTPPHALYAIPGRRPVPGRDLTRGRAGSPMTQTRHRSSSWDSSRRDSEPLGRGPDRSGGSPEVGWAKAETPSPQPGEPGEAASLLANMSPEAAQLLSKDFVSNMTLGSIEKLQRVLDEYKSQLLRQGEGQRGGRVSAGPGSRPVTPLRQTEELDGPGAPPFVPRIPSPSGMPKVSHAASPVMVQSVFSSDKMRRVAAAAGSRRGRQRAHRSLARSASPVLKGTLRRKMSRDDTESIVSEGLEEVGLSGKVEEDFDEVVRSTSGCMAPDAKMFRSSFAPRAGSAELSAGSDGGGVDSEPECPRAPLSSSPGNISFVNRVAGGGPPRKLSSTVPTPWDLARQAKEQASSSQLDVLSPDPSKGVECISSPRSAFIPAQH